MGDELEWFQVCIKFVTSLYPTINKYGTYPIGHPTIVVNPENQNIHNYFGIALVDVLAPDRLFQ